MVRDQGKADFAPHHCKIHSIVLWRTCLLNIYIFHLIPKLKTTTKIQQIYKGYKLCFIKSMPNPRVHSKEICIEPNWPMDCKTYGLFANQWLQSRFLYTKELPFLFHEKGNLSKLKTPSQPDYKVFLWKSLMLKNTVKSYVLLHWVAPPTEDYSYIPSPSRGQWHNPTCCPPSKQHAHVTKKDSTVFNILSQEN